MYQHLKYLEEKGVATISLNRPEVYNALNNPLKKELFSALSAAASDENIRVIVLTGEGKAFCSGQDLKAAAEETKDSYGEAIRQYYNPLISYMRTLPKPIVCKLNGVAAGAGCSLALACDLIIATESATLAELFVGIGLVPDCGSSFFLPRLTSRVHAFELATTGRKITAREALELGLVNRVAADQDLDKVVDEYLLHYRNAPTRVIGYIKEMLNQTPALTLNDALELEANYQDKASQTADHEEGMRAFMEKRPPKFKGN
jgi:2-(1,2-epoxy-1,2-dihydrophenyl)acetyl-CoA isomerase